MTDHKPYEVLCALAATGQLAAFEKANFDEHCIECPGCRRQLQDLLSIGLQLELDAAIHAVVSPMAAGSLERFRARAICEGIPLQSAPVRPLPSFALAAAAAVLVLVAALIFIPGRRKAPDSVAMSADASIPIRQSSPASVTGRKSTPQPSNAIHTNFARHRFVPHANSAGTEADLKVHTLPGVITTSYSFFGSESATKPLSVGYPAFSRSQIAHLALFPKLDGSSATNFASIGTSNRPIDIASSGKLFDFATNIRQIHFQVPTAQ